MDINQIKKLGTIFESLGLSKLEICEGDVKILLEKNHTQTTNSVATVPLAINDLTQEEASPLPEVVRREVDFKNMKEVKSPMVGVFYQAPSPDSEPFVQIGSRVKKGDVLCIIEAMKLMNEIVAETDGEIIDICVENGQVVEFSEVLFKII